MTQCPGPRKPETWQVLKNPIRQWHPAPSSAENLRRMLLSSGWSLQYIHKYVRTYIHSFICTYLYVYIQRERERERERDVCIENCAPRFVAGWLAEPKGIQKYLDSCVRQGRLDNNCWAHTLRGQRPRLESQNALSHGQNSP